MIHVEYINKFINITIEYRNISLHKVMIQLFEYLASDSNNMCNACVVNNKVHDDPCII